MDEPSPAPQVRHRQLLLLSVGNPLASRLGEGFFKSLPAAPGVYRFFDASNRLLYIGQSNDLRARVGSYRHVSPERHPKRTLRMVHRIARVEWEPCESAAAAIELERVLLLEKRPPFNRAGVWQGPPWWLRVSSTDGRLCITLTRHAAADGRAAGPLPSAFRYVHAVLLRCVTRLLHPVLPLSEYPVGLLNHTAPLRVQLEFPAWQIGVADQLTAYAKGVAAPLLESLDLAFAQAEATSEVMQTYWTEQLDSLRVFAAKRQPVPVEQSLAPSEPLPLLPGW